MPSWWAMPVLLMEGRAVLAWTLAAMISSLFTPQTLRTILRHVNPLLDKSAHERLGLLHKFRQPEGNPHD